MLNTDLAVGDGHGDEKLTVAGSDLDNKNNVSCSQIFFPTQAIPAAKRFDEGHRGEL